MTQPHETRPPDAPPAPMSACRRAVQVRLNPVVHRLVLLAAVRGLLGWHHALPLLNATSS